MMLLFFLNIWVQGAFNNSQNNDAQTVLEKLLRPSFDSYVPRSVLVPSITIKKQPQKQLKLE